MRRQLGLFQVVDVDLKRCLELLEQVDVLRKEFQERAMAAVLASRMF